MKYLKSVFIYSTLCCIACSSPQKSFEKGNYERAFNGALTELDKKDNSRQNKVLLNKSFEELIYHNEKENYKLVQSGLIENLEVVHANNLDIIDKYHNAKRYLNPVYDTIASDFVNRNDLLRENIALAYWDEGNTLMDVYNSTGDKFKAQDANFNYTKAYDYNIGYEAIDSLLDVSFAAGLIHVLVETNVWDMNYSWRVDNTFKNLIHLSRGFNQVHYENMISIADCRIDVSFNNIEVIENTTRETQQFTREIEDGYTTKVDSSGNTHRILNYITVRGEGVKEITTWTYNWRVRSTVRQLSPFCQMNNRHFDERGEIRHVRYDVTGDVRAVPEEYQNVTFFNRSTEEEKLINRMIDDIYDDFVQYYFR
ncbi:MAG: hypothetical protein HKN09_08730 [Saprospiraceae bacterium]|nr:hypothetical protein [Saprospiraceae bacterium]